MKRVLILPLLLLLFLQPLRLHAQTFSVNADLVSGFLWRGMDCGSICFQPYMTLEHKGFSIMAWGSTDLRTYDTHVDLFLSYKKNGFQVQLADYFAIPKGGNFSYFDFDAHSTMHTAEAILSYQLGGKLPFSFTWATFFAGADYYNADGKRSYSSYFEVAYPFSAFGLDFKAEAGITPWEGMYADKFNVVNLGIGASKEIAITDKFSVPVWCKLIVNPAVEQTYVVFGLTF